MSTKSAFQNPEGPRARRIGLTAALRSYPPVSACVTVIAPLATLGYWARRAGRVDAATTALALMTQPAHDVWRGAWWTLVTSAFLHVDGMHLFFNLYWIWRIAAPAERLVGSARWAAFFVASTAFASWVQLVVGDAAGIGLSGFGYAYFGFAWRRSKTDPRWRGVLRSGDPALWTAWLALCWILTLADLWLVANWAHLGGLAFGAAAAYVSERGRRRALAVAAAAVPVAAAAALVRFGCPWSGAWHEARGLDATHRREFDAAAVEFRRAKELRYMPAYSVELLAWNALSALRSDDYESAMTELAKLDSSQARRAREEFERGSAVWLMEARKALRDLDAEAAVASLTKARDRGGDRSWCLENLAWAYWTLGRGPEYDATVQELKTADPDAYRRTIARYAPAAPRDK